MSIQKDIIYIILNKFKSVLCSFMTCLDGVRVEGRKVMLVKNKLICAKPPPSSPSIQTKH